MSSPSASSSRPSLRILLTGAAAAVAVILVVMALSGRKPPPTASKAIGARLELAAGDVTVTDAGTSAKALSRTPLPAGARIATGKGSRALVRAGDGAAVFLRGESEVALGDKGLELARGEIWLDAPKIDGEAVLCKAGSHTITATEAGLSIKRTGDDVTVYVARGLAVLTSPAGRVEINAGEQGTTASGAPPKIAAVAFWQDWTGGMGDAKAGHGSVGSGAGRIYGIEPNARPGAPARKLGIAKQAVRAVVRDGLSETEVDQTFSNPGGGAIEGWYWFTVPAEAIVTSFALETDGVLVEGEVIEKKEAAARYEAAKRRANDPALLEWVDGQSYRAKIFPIPPNGTRRVVLRYTEVLPLVDGKTRYVYPLRSDDAVRFDEFALSVDLGPNASDLSVATSLDARVEENGRKVTMRRSGYVPRADFQLEMTQKQKAAGAAVRAWRFEAGSDQADYVMLRYVPDLDFSKLPPSKGEVVVVVDTSAGGDESARALRNAAAEAILRALSDEDRFAVVALDVKPTVVYPEKGLASASEGEIAKALERLTERGVGGASDLGAMFEPALERLHGTEQPAMVYVGDGLATSGETTPDGLTERLRRSLTGSRARLFTVAVGTDANHGLLAQLARTGGGQHVRIDEAEQATGQALRLTSAIKTPTITDLDVDLGAGLDQPFLSATGKLARGEELMLVARTHHKLPEKVKIKGRAGGKDFVTEYPVPIEKGVATALVPRLWAAEYVRRLLGSGASADDNRSKVLDLGLEYGLMTPYTSILALDSEAAYARDGIKRRNSRLRGVRLTSIDGDRREAELAALFDPTLPPAVIGCSKSEAPSSADNREGGMGTRAKGEEGTVSDKPSSRYAAPAVAAAPAAQATATASPTSAAEPESQSRDESAAPTAGPAAPGRAAGIAGLGAMSKPAGGGGARPTGAAEKAKTIADGKDPLDLPAPAPPPVALPPKAGAKKDALDRDQEKKQANAKIGDVLAKPAPVPGGVIAVPRKPLGTCSDAASRPLAERVVLWKKRMKQAATIREVLVQYELARSGCELPDWRDQAALLDLVQARVQTEEAAEAALAHFASETEARGYVARAVLRRTVDVRLAAAVSRALYGGRVDWAKVDRDVLDAKPDDRVKKLREAMLAAPGDPAGDVRLVRLLAQTGERAEALAYGRRMRDRGLMTPTLAVQLGDVLAEAKEDEEARRTYSEIVEFDGENAASRRVLGDVFLRHGWYAAAYRQYKTLTDLDPKGPSGWLRLAAAASGAGRVDEALRLERQVATGEGTPGPEDPRHWAKLWSAARLGLLLENPGASGGTPEAIGRKLKELSIFSGPGTLALLTWQDLDARLSLVAADDKKEALVGEVTDAGATGLVGILSSTEAWERGTWAARWKSEGRRPVAFSLVVLTWDGKAFSVKVKRGSLKPEELKTPF